MRLNCGQIFYGFGTPKRKESRNLKKNVYLRKSFGLIMRLGEYDQFVMDVDRMTLSGGESS